MNLVRIVFPAIAFGFFAMSIAVDCSCRKDTTDMRTLANAPNTNLPTVKEMDSQVSIGMPRQHVIDLLGKAFSGGGDNDSFDAIYDGRDGSLGIIFKGDKITDIQPMPRQTYGEKVAQKRLLVREGMTKCEVWKALGKPNGTGGERSPGMKLEELQYYCSDGKLVVSIKNGRVIGLTSN